MFAERIIMRGIIVGKAARRILCLLVAFLLFLGSFSFINDLSTVPVQASGTKAVTNRAIAIVFDNSGSMYSDDNGNNLKAWCQATYAMEVFASMLNEGDVLYIYPMNDMKIGNKEYNYSTPFKLSAGDDTSQIRNIVSLDSNYKDGWIGMNTPIEPVNYAREDLVNVSDSYEKWLIVITDGADFYLNDKAYGADSKGWLEWSLSDAVNGPTDEKGNTDESQSVNVMYLGIGTDVIIPEVSVSSDKKFKVFQAQDSENVLARLTDASNEIFGRDSIEYNKGEGVTFGVTLSKAIVFVQGENISNIKLTNNDDGTEIKKTGEFSPRYSDKGLESGAKGAKDETLSGVIATFEDIENGTYSVSYDGNVKSAAIYYEPDVYLRIDLVDQNGNVVTGDEDSLEAGDYKLKFGLADGDEFVSEEDSGLLGSNIVFSGSYTVNGNETEINVKGAGVHEIPLTFEAGDSFEDIIIDVQYLNGYEDRKTGDDLEWFVKISGKMPFVAPEFIFTASVTPEEEQSYSMSLLENEAKYSVDLSFERLAVGTSSALELNTRELYEGGAVVTASVNGAAWDVEFDSTSEKYVITAPAGTQLDKGSYDILINFAYSDAAQEIDSSGQATVTFKVEDDSKLYKINLSAEQTYYQLSKLADGKPIKVSLTYNKEPLSAEQFAMVTMDWSQIDSKLQYTIEEKADESAYYIHITGGEEGSYAIKARANVANVSKSLEDSVGVQLARWPQWVKYAIAGAALLVLLLLLFLFFNMKVLPKSAVQTKTEFSVGGDKVKGNANVRLVGGGKKSGSLQINSPRCNTNPGAKCSISIPLKAVSPRRVKSSARKGQVTELPSLSRAINSAMFGVIKFVRKDKGFVKQGSSKTEFTPFEIGGTKVYSFSGTVRGDDGNDTSMSLKVTIKFK